MWLRSTEIHVANCTVFFYNNRKLEGEKTQRKHTVYYLVILEKKEKLFSYAEFFPVSRVACLTFGNFRKLADSQTLELRHFES